MVLSISDYRAPNSVLMVGHSKVVKRPIYGVRELVILRRDLDMKWCIN